METELETRTSNQNQNSQQLNNTEPNESPTPIQEINSPNTSEPEVTSPRPIHFIETREYRKQHYGKYEGKLTNKDENKSKCCNFFHKKNVKNFYKKQELLEELFEEDQALIQKSEHPEENTAEEIKRQKTDKWRERVEKFSLTVSFLMNILIFLIKLTAAITSLSLSVLASTLDSFLDLFSGLILYFTNRFRRKKNDEHKYPVGKTRLEPIGFIIFAAVMSTSSLEIIKESIELIINNLITPITVEVLVTPFDYISYYIGIFALGFTIIAKSCLYLMCRFQKWSPSVIALSMDHRNDVISNSLLLTAILISKFLYPQYTWVLDPLAATIASLYIIKNWVQESYDLIVKLIGLSPSSGFHQRLTRIAFNHHPSVLFIDTVRAFHVGVGIWVELDIGLDPETPLNIAHDIGESLQKKIELIDDVERCFVHIDYEKDHRNIDEHKEIF
eukprot:gene4519-7897_t